MSVRRRSRRGGLKKREMAADVNRPLRDKSTCPTPHKVSYPTKHHAKVALRRALPANVASNREYAKTQAAEARPPSLPRPYRCRCGRWHTGHLPTSIRSGAAHRSDVYGGEAAA